MILDTLTYSIIAISLLLTSAILFLAITKKSEENSDDV